MKRILHPFEELVSAYIRRHNLLRLDYEQPAPVIVALSGGADSVSLLSVLCALGYQCSAAHCNFHLRGSESMRDAEYVAALCKRLNVDLFIREFDVHARVHATGESLEMACRELRYAWFASLLDREYAQAVAVGHHREDQAETVILNLLRGSGPGGIAGMKPRRSDIAVVRPLLECSREQIESYLADKNLQWVHDSSNDTDDFKRNRIRHHLLPLMEALIPGAVDGILRSAGYCGDMQAFYDESVAELAARYCTKDGSEIDLTALRDRHPETARLILYGFIRRFGFNMTQARDMVRSPEGASGLVFQGKDGNILELSRGTLTLRNCADSFVNDDVDVSLKRDILAPAYITVSRHDVTEFSSDEDNGNPAVLFVDARAAESGRWQLRHWQRGDRMRPFGMKGTKLVSDIFAGARLDAQGKRRAWLLTRNGAIVWIPGIRASALHTITPETRYYVKLRFQNS